jgi:hypothetical protein
VIVDTTDITSVVQGVRVTDTLERSPSTAAIGLSRQVEAWEDPIGNDAALLQAGTAITVEMREYGMASWVRIFDGEIISGKLSSELPIARNVINAVSGKEMWWTKPVTFEEYTATDTDDIVEDLFVDHGGLATPADFDLPGVARVLTWVQGIEQSIMELAFKLYEPMDRVPYWDPVQQKLSTLDTSIPIAADLVLSDVDKARLSFDWGFPSATRVSMQGGALRDLQRIEIGYWPTPSDRAAGNPLKPEGVRWASGSKHDWAEPPWWAESDGSNPHYGVYDAGPPKDYLWVRFLYDWAPTTGTGYRGPEGIEFILNDPLVSTDPVSQGRYRVEQGSLSSTYFQFTVETERFDADEQIQLCWMLVRMECDSWTPAPAGKLPDAYWQEILDATTPISWDIYGRQLQEGSLDQHHAQVWDTDLIDVHGDRQIEVRNETLLQTTDGYKAVEDEAARLLVLEKAKRYPGRIPLVGQDLRLLPGDCVQVDHPRQSRTLLVHARTVEQSWENGKASTNVSGIVVGTV